MAEFITTNIIGKLSYIGFVASRERDLRSQSLQNVELRFGGIDGDCHGGRNRPSCSRVTMIHKKGTEIANARQLSIMSIEELAEIALDAGISQNLPQWWGANLVFDNIPALSALPPSSRLIFPSGAVVRVDVENGPCVYAAKVVEEETGGDAATIKAAAKHRRGVVGSVEAEGLIAIGDAVKLVIPNARPYRYAH